MQHNQNTKQGKQKEWLTEHTNCAVEISVMLMLKGNQTEDTGWPENVQIVSSAWFIWS